MTLDRYLDKYRRMEECQKKNIMICKGCNAVLFGVSISVIAATEAGGYQARCFDSGTFTRFQNVGCSLRAQKFPNMNNSVGPIYAGWISPLTTCSLSMSCQRLILTLALSCASCWLLSGFITGWRTVRSLGFPRYVSRRKWMLAGTALLTTCVARHVRRHWDKDKPSDKKLNVLLCRTSCNIPSIAEAGESQHFHSWPWKGCFHYRLWDTAWRGQSRVQYLHRQLDVASAVKFGPRLIFAAVFLHCRLACGLIGSADSR